jgi:quercetin dioxygenase-like cupin family protein
MSTPVDYTFLSDLLAEIDIPADGTLSLTIHQDDRVKVILFGFDTGQELSEHTASKPAILHVLKGRGRLTLGGDVQDVADGAWVHMPPHLPHAVHAASPLVMLLILLK